MCFYESDVRGNSVTHAYQLIRYARSCSKYEHFIARSNLLTLRLFKQGYSESRLLAAFQKFYGRHHTIVDKYNQSATKMADIGLNTSTD